MTDAPISARAAFDRIRYAQLWEDADVLCTAIGDVSGGTLLSVCSAGDNALALLTLDPARVVAADLSPAQLECLRLRIAAMQVLDQPDYLELMGARPSERRGALLSRVLAKAPPQTKDFWEAQRAEAVAYGAGGVGKFERYFRLFSKALLPLVHSRRTVREIFVPRTPDARADWFERRFDTWRWRLLVRGFFSRWAMGRLGRDQAFFDHVKGSVSDHVLRRVRHAGVDTDPSQNPYLHWIMTETHGEALPLPWRPEAYDVIRNRLDRVTLHLGPMEEADVQDAAGFNLSDIFEYMSPNVAEAAYESFLAMARPGARLVYWNMMAPRRCPAAFANRIDTLSDIECAGKARDMAFFYRDFVVEQVR